jgi:hypothetical protein
MKYEARAFDGGTGSSSPKGEKVQENKAEAKTEAFNGVLTLGPEAFGRFYECMTNPGKPTAAIHKGEAFLRSRYKKQS